MKCTYRLKYEEYEIILLEKTTNTKFEKKELKNSRNFKNITFQKT